MALELDARQRAMLLEMGVRVYMAPIPATLSEPAPAPIATPVLRAPQLAVPVPNPAPTSAVAAADPQSAASVSVPRPLPLQDGSAEALAHAAANCSACGLCAGRKNTTLRAEALRQSDWMVVCDPPDEWEERAGSPAVHEAGQLLDNMLRAVGKDRHSSGVAGAYVTNVVKCKPPHGYVPQHQDLLQCATYLRRELEIVQPKQIVALGRFACQLLLSEHPELAALPLGKQRGKVYHYQGIPVVVSYGLYDLLRRGTDKAKAWADLCLALQQSSIYDNNPP